MERRTNKEEESSLTRGWGFVVCQVKDVAELKNQVVLGVLGESRGDLLELDLLLSNVPVGRVGVLLHGQ